MFGGEKLQAGSRSHDAEMVKCFEFREAERLEYSLDEGGARKMAQVADD